MSRPRGTLDLKRKQPESRSAASTLNDQERILYEVIQSKEGMGIWTRDMKRESNLPDAIVNKSLKTLLGKRLIKEVVNVQNKARKHFMASEFEPSRQLTGGDWYIDGNLDMELIEALREICLKQMKKMKFFTVDKIVDVIKKSGAFNLDITTRQIGEIIESLLLDGKIIKVKSNGIGDFASFPVGADCYKCSNREGPKLGAMASLPCGVCPQISMCTPDGIISPKTCVYFTKWLDF